ncbi:MAG TPA: IS630 family transposase, partial [Candidatus Competibacteraceae bacterium]|nr:IS630 family transposase [Candidatus Competibacteraceae bacterium]
MAAMEDVLDVYERPADPQRPMVCVDELHTQLIGETRLPIAATAGQVERVDYEYVRNGTANIFIAFEPLSAYRLTKVTAQRTR